MPASSPMRVVQLPLKKKKINHLTKFLVLSSKSVAAVVFPSVPNPLLASTAAPSFWLEARKQAMTNKGKDKSTETINADFLPLEGGPARKLPKGGESNNKATVLYIGRIPHGFYEDEMEGFFQQFGTIKRLKIARNRKTGKSKHYGFIEFEYPEVAKIVSECMHNYLLFENMLQVHLIPPERVHTKLWKGLSRRQRTPIDFVQIERMKHNKDRTLEEHKKLLKAIMKRDKKRRSKIEAAGVDYECLEIEGASQPAPKKIRFED